MFEPPAFDLHWVNESGGLVSHTVYVEGFPGPYPFALDPAYPGGHRASGRDCRLGLLAFHLLACLGV